MRALAQTLLAPTLLVLALGGCVDTRSTCEIECDNQVRCGFAPDRAACLSTCTTALARATPDCRTQSDRYQRCWSGAGTCPFSPALAAPGCATEHADRALACTSFSPLLGPEGI